MKFNLCRIAWSALFLTAALAASGAGTATTAPSPDMGGLFDDPVIARGKGVEIKRSQLEDAFTSYRARMAERKQEVTEAQRPLLEKQLLDSLIVSKILVLRASAEDKAKAKERTQQLLSNYITNTGSEEALKRQLKLRGSNLEKFTRDVDEEEAARLVLDRELKSTITIPDAQVLDYYNNGVDALVKIMQEELERLAKDSSTTPVQLAATKNRIDELKKNNLAKLELLEQVRVSHILFSTQDRKTEKQLPEDQKKAKLDLATQVLARARAGENFTNLVDQFSEDRNVKENHGQYLVRRTDPFVPEFKAAALSLTNGQISDVVTTVFGYHIIKRYEVIPARKLELEKVSQDIRRALLEQELERQMPDYFAKLKKEAGVEILDPKYRFTSTARDLIKPGN